MKKACLAVVLSFISTGVAYAEPDTASAISTAPLADHSPLASDMPANTNTNTTTSSQPAGGIIVTSANGTPMNALALNIGLAHGGVGAALRSAATQGTFVMAGVDSSNRAYEYDVGPTALTIPSHTLEDFFEASNRIMRYGEMVLDFNGSKMAVASHVINPRAQAGSSAIDNLAQNDAVAGTAILHKFINGHEIAAGVGGMNLFFGLENSDIPGVLSLASSRLSNPYLDLMPQASSVGYGIPIGDGLKLKLGMATSALAPVTYARYGLPSYDVPRSSMAVAEVSKNFQDGVVAVEMAKLNERNAMLGTQMGSGFGLNEKANTMAVTINAAYRLSYQMAIAGYISHGSTRGFMNTGESLVTKVSDTKSQAFGAGLTYLDPFVEDDRLMISISSPLKTTSGEISLNVPTIGTGGSEAGVIVRDERSVNLGDGHREVITEANYYVPLSRDSGLNATFLFRQNADNMAKREEVIAAVRYTFNF